MEVQEPALNKQSKDILGNIEASLDIVFQIEDSIPEDMKALLDQLNTVDFCREVALEIAEQRLCRLLSNTANQSAK